MRASGPLNGGVPLTTMVSDPVLDYGPMRENLKTFYSAERAQVTTENRQGGPLSFALGSLSSLLNAPTHQDKMS